MYASFSLSCQQNSEKKFEVRHLSLSSTALAYRFNIHIHLTFVVFQVLNNLINITKSKVAILKSAKNKPPDKGKQQNRQFFHTAQRLYCKKKNQIQGGEFVRVIIDSEENSMQLNNNFPFMLNTFLSMVQFGLPQFVSFHRFIASSFNLTKFFHPHPVCVHSVWHNGLHHLNEDALCFMRKYIHICIHFEDAPTALYNLCRDPAYEFSIQCMAVI